MAWPIILVGMAGTAALGAFVGSQVDDAIETPAQSPMDDIGLNLSPTRIAYYAILGGATFWVLTKSGVLKKIGF